MAGAGGEEWIYVLSQQEAVDDAEAEQAVAATAAEQENNKPSNPDDGETAAEEEEKESNDNDDDDDEASAQPSESDHKAAQSSSSKDGGGAQQSSDDEDRREEEEYPAYYTQEEVEYEKEYAKNLARLEALLAGSSEAFERAVKVDDDGAAAPSTGGPGGRRVMENPYYDRYNSNDDTYAEPYPYYRGYGGGSGPGFLGRLGSGYDYRSYYDGFGFGFGFPGAYGPATGSGYGYGGYAGWYYVEPTYPYVPGYQTVVYQAPPPAFSASFYPLPPPMPYVYPAPAPAPVSIRRPGSRRRYSARADEPSPLAVAPTTQPPEPSRH